MRKRARRLWLGDWQRDAPDQGDTVVILPDDEGEAAPDSDRPRDLRRALAGVAAIALLCALVVVVSSGGDGNSPTSAVPAIPPAQTPQPQPPQGAAPPGFGGPDLTGAAAIKAAKAALAQYPGDIERVTQGPGGGGYIVHVIQPDGNEVHVVVSDGFKVLGSDAGRFGGGAQPPTPGDGSTNPS